MLDQWTVLQNLLPTLPTISLSDSTASSLSDYMQLPLEPHQALYYCFHTCSGIHLDL